MGVEKIAELKIELLKIAKEYFPEDFEKMTEKYKELCKEFRLL